MYLPWHILIRPSPTPPIFTSSVLSLLDYHIYRKQTLFIFISIESKLLLVGEHSWTHIAVIVQFLFYRRINGIPGAELGHLFWAEKRRGITMEPVINRSSSWF